MTERTEYDENTTPARVPATETTTDETMTTRDATVPPGDPGSAIDSGSGSAAPDWNREEWAGENEPHLDDIRDAADAVTGRREHWNAHEFVGEGQGAPDEGPEGLDPTIEGDNDLSGHGHNPGGGERWADVDRG